MQTVALEGRFVASSAGLHLLMERLKDRTAMYEKEPLGGAFLAHAAWRRRRELSGAAVIQIKAQPAASALKNKAITENTI
ncbi:MAG: hypothetical protein AAF713_06580 [Pseudomonadota bacterium]